MHLSSILTQWRLRQRRGPPLLRSAHHRLLFRLLSLWSLLCRLPRLLHPVVPGVMAQCHATVACRLLCWAFAFCRQVPWLIAAEAFRLLHFQQPDPVPGLPDDHGPRLCHLDGRVVRDLDERGPVNTAIVPSPPSATSLPIRPGWRQRWPALSSCPLRWHAEEQDRDLLGEGVDPYGESISRKKPPVLVCRVLRTVTPIFFRLLSSLPRRTLPPFWSDNQLWPQTSGVLVSAVARSALLFWTALMVVAREKEKRVSSSPYGPPFKRGRLCWPEDRLCAAAPVSVYSCSRSSKAPGIDHFPGGELTRSCLFVHPESVVYFEVILYIYKTSP